jgi:hypothetical protein
MPIGDANYSDGRGHRITPDYPLPVGWIVVDDLEAAGLVPRISKTLRPAQGTTLARLHLPRRRADRSMRLRREARRTKRARRSREFSSGCP